MRVLIVTPVEGGSGETVTAIRMAERITEADGDARFLASPFASRLIGNRFSNVTTVLGSDGGANRRLWRSLVTEYRPSVIVFADYPLLTFSGGTSPLWMEEWERDLEDIDAFLVTLDHMGFAQRPMGVFFGPPHLSFQFESIPAIPANMRIMLPCPMHEPLPVAGRNGQPFRYWNLPLTITEDERRSVRRRYLGSDDELLLIHAVAPWARESAAAAGIPYYEFLPRILCHYLAGIGRQVTLVSINDVQLLAQPPGASLRIHNLSSLPSDEYDRLLLSADLLVTENKISISLGKAICGLVPCVSLRNSFRFRELLQGLSGELRDIVVSMERARSGSVFPYGVFPVGMDDELERLGLYRENSIVRGFRELEIFGGEQTRVQLQLLLTNDQARSDARSEQEAYLDRLQQIEFAEHALARLVAAPGDG